MLKSKRFFFYIVITLCAGCGGQVALDDTLAARNMRSYERWIDHFVFVLPCTNFLIFPNIGEVEEALCELTPFFDCGIASAFCVDEFPFVDFDIDCSSLVPVGCIPGPIEPYSVLTPECLSRSEIQDVRIGWSTSSPSPTAEGTAFSGRYSLAMTGVNTSFSTSCRECSPDTITNSCREDPFPEWNTLAVDQDDGSIDFGVVDVTDSVFARLTGVVDADGFFVVGVMLPKTDEHGEMLVRMEGTFSSQGFLAVLSVRTSNLGFGPSDFQHDWDVAYRRESECPEEGLLACFESGLLDDFFLEMFTLAQNALDLDFETPEAIGILNDRCQTLCSNDLCAASCPACATALIDQARCHSGR
jgi:hypothetical protein